MISCTLQICFADLHKLPTTDVRATSLPYLTPSFNTRPVRQKGPGFQEKTARGEGPELELS